MQKLYLLWILALVASTDAFYNVAWPTPTQAIGVNKAIVPTTTGQIGINPVESDLGDATTYIGEIYGDDTKYITVAATITKWIGVNTNYLTVETINPASTSTVKIVVATATASANGQSVGDVSIILPEGLAVALQSSVTEGINACNAVPAKLRRRNMSLSKRQADEVLTCLLGKASSAESIIDKYVDPEAWKDFAVTLADDAVAVLQTGLAGLTAPVRAKAILWLAIGAATINVLSDAKRLGQTLELAPIGKVNIPASGFATPISKTGCPLGAKKDIDSPLCVAEDCQGANGICVVDPHKNCPCLELIPEPIGMQLLNQSYFELQQAYLKELMSMSVHIPTSTSTSTSTSCSIVATQFPASAQSIAGTGTVRFCTCGSIMAGINLAVSAASTTSYCATGGGAPRGFTQIPADSNGHPYTTSKHTTTSPTSRTPTATPCVGNQVQGSCIAGVLPSASPYSGVQAPVCAKAVSRINSLKASAAATAYCQRLISKNIILSAKSTALPAYVQPGIAENGKAMTLTVLFYEAACPKDKSMTDVDFKEMGQRECVDNFFTQIKAVCSQDRTWGDYNPEYTVEGGVFGNDCAMWSISVT